MKISTQYLIILFILIGYLTPFTSSAQDYYRSEPKLEEIPSFDKLQPNATIIEDNRSIQYKTKNRVITRHRIVRIHTQEGLDDNNKVIIYVPDESELNDIQARSISKDGEVIEIDQSNIKLKENYEGDGNLQMFAIEGAEVGGEIEYIYSLKTPVYSGGKETFSKNYPTLSASLKIKSFSDFKLDSKAYNWEFEQERLNKVHSYNFTNILPVEEEKYSTPDSRAVFVEYKVVQTAYGKTIFADYEYWKVFNYKSLFDYNKFELKIARKSIKKLLKKSDITDKKEQLKAVHDYLKNTYFYKPGYSNDLSELTTVLKNYKGNDEGLVKVYGLFLAELGINFKILMTGNKYEYWIDEDYCSPFSFSEYVIFIPLYELYVYPSSPASQLGHVPQWIVGNTALIIDQNLSVVSFMEIPSKNAEKNKTFLRMDIGLNFNENTSKIAVGAYGTGQIAFNYNQDYLFTESEEDKMDNIKSYLSWRFEDAEINDIQLINKEAWGDISACDDYECKREFSAELISSNLFENMGKKVLINIGKVIGPQSELYSETDRILPINNSYNKSYEFEINITIPEGYRYAGEENVVIDNEFKSDKGIVFAGFQSSVKQEGNVIKINIHEYYNQINLDKKYYEEFRKIINSAADWNKAIILLEQE